MSKPRVEVSNWDAGHGQEGLASGPVRYAGTRVTRILGLSGTLLLHALVIHTALLGSHRHFLKVPDTQGPGATFVKSETVPSETLILIDLPKASMDQSPLVEDLASRGTLAKDLSAMLLSPDSMPHVDIPLNADESDEKSADAAVDSGDPAARAVLFGRYTGQIDARIERAWRRPRSPVEPGRKSLAATESPRAAPPEFNCKVRILQDARGYVQEVQMLQCNGSIPWQQSLVTAILAVSPLPAPPDPSVFTTALIISFTAAQFTKNSSTDDDYELESLATIADVNSR